MPNRPIDRRAFLGGAIGAGIALAGYPQLQQSAAASGPRNVRRLLASSDGILDHPAAECPIDTVVIVMMENRSFDHYLGWLGDASTWGSRVPLTGTCRMLSRASMQFASLTACGGP